jgi:hypothetical protein
MKKNEFIDEKHTLIKESIRKSYNIIYECLNSLDFIPELFSIKEKNSENEKLSSLLIFFGASYFKKWARSLL